MLLTASATAHYVPPLVVFPGQNFHMTFVEEFYIFPDTIFGHSLSGWMDQDLFYNWLEHSFIPEIEKCHIPKPVLLLIDGAKVHISLFIFELCNEHNVILYTYLPNLTHLLQALDLELMGLVKTTYQQEVQKWMSNNIEKFYDKLGVMQVFRIVFDKCSTVSNAKEGFKKSRVFPWNLSIIDDKKLAPLTMFEKQTELPNVNSSINECVPASGDKGNEDDVQNVTQTVAKVHSVPVKAKEPSGMGVTIWPDGLLKEVIIDGIHYTMTPLDELKEACVPTSATVPVSSAKRSKILNKVLTTLVVKMKETPGVRMLKILRCISLKDCQKLMRDKEEEENEDWKQMRQAKAEE